jgi:two-component system sensor histidine kinase YesM
MKKRGGDFRKIFGGITIGKRLVFFILFVVLVPLAIILALFYGRFYNIIQNSLLDSQVVTSMQAAKLIDNAAKSLLAVGDTVLADERLPRLLGQAGPDDGDPQAAYHSDLEMLRSVVQSHVDGTSISAIRIYSDAAPIDGDPDGELFMDVAAIRHTYWYGIFNSQPIDTLFAPEYYLGGAERTQLGSLALIQKSVFAGETNPVTVYVAVYTYSDMLARPLQDIELESVEGIISYILNSRDTVVAQTDATAYGTYAMSYADIAQNIQAEGIFMQKDVAGTSVFITYRDIAGTDWRLTWIVPHASIMAQSKHVIFQFVLIYSLMALLVIIIGIAISRTIVGRIKSLRDQMQQMKSERPEPLTLPPGQDEVGELIETYNYMVERINALLDDTIAATEELNSVKIKALRAQIDPHFLYNTLDMTNWLIKAGKNDKASEAVMALSRFYRLTLNRGNLTATVSAELAHVSLYMKLMNMRFDDKIEYLVDMPEDMLDYEIPLIIFQPIVENAIQHGIFEKPSKSGKIIITGWSDEETLYFLISDDGIGMTAEQIDKLLQTQTDADTGNGIGAYNTHRRLQLMYHRDDCGLYYSSEYGKGTDVTFRIPKHMDKKEAEGRDEGL